MSGSKPSENDAVLDSWLAMEDLENRTLNSSTWIPLHVSEYTKLKGKSGHPGFRKEYHSVDSLIVPCEFLDDMSNLGWQTVSRINCDGAWADKDQFIPAGCFDENPELRYPVLIKGFDTGEPTQWELFQEIDFALQLLRIENSWILPEENDVEVARLIHDNGKPSRLEMKAEYLRDYLCAKQAHLLVMEFWFRDSVESSSSFVGWPEGARNRELAHGSWEGHKIPIHEGGALFGSGGVVLKMWRESVDPESDMPTMPHPTAEKEAKSETTEFGYEGKKLWAASGKAWLKHWVKPAGKSPRIRRDQVASRVSFVVDNQEQNSLSGNDLADHDGWLWFRPTVIPFLLKQPKSEFRWYTESTGEIGPDRIQTMHFGVNSIGLINVVAYKMADLSPWVQKLWAAHNVPPEGGLSEELHMSQNLAEPAKTVSPEVGLWRNLNGIVRLTSSLFGESILRALPDEKDFFKRIHRFHGDSFEDFCRLCKDLNRTVAEQFNIGVINSKIDPDNAVEAKRKNLREIKRVAFWLTNLGLDGREMTRVFAGVNDLRVGDAHSGGDSLRDSLEILKIPRDSTDYATMSFHVIGETANAIGLIGAEVEKHYRD